MNKPMPLESEKKKRDLYEFELNRFQTLLDDNKNYAFSRYGLTLLYSLPPQDTFELLNALGFQAQDPIDYYNKGVIECKNDNLQEALKHFKTAESMQCELPELYYNIAAIYEEEDNSQKAKAYYQKYVDRVEQYDSIPKNLRIELDEVRQHLAQMEQP